MKIRAVAAITIAVALAVSAPALAAPHTQGQSKPPETKPDAKAEARATAATLAGQWNVTVNTGSAELKSTVELKADPKDQKKVSGTITSTEGTRTPLEGTVVEGKLTFSFTFDAQGTSVVLTFVGTQQKDGSMAGTFNFGQAEMTWTAVKDKK